MHLQSFLQWHHNKTTLLLQKKETTKNPTTTTKNKNLKVEFNRPVRSKCSSSHRKQVGMKGMQSGNTLIEGAAVAGQNAKKSFFFFPFRKKKKRRRRSEAGKRFVPVRKISEWKRLGIVKMHDQPGADEGMPPEPRRRTRTSKTNSRQWTDWRQAQFFPTILTAWCG